MDREEKYEDLHDEAARVILGVLNTSGFRMTVVSVVRSFIGQWSRKGGRSGRTLASFVDRRLERYQRKKRRSPASGESLPAEVGAFLSTCAGRYNAETDEERTERVRVRREFIREFIEHADFGEIREAVERSRSEATETVAALNDVLWKYPAKVASILSLFPETANISMQAGRELLRPVENKVGPDLLADLGLSLLRKVDGRQAAECLNAVCELIRRFHTGSLLLGKGGRPLLELYCTDILKDAVEDIDTELFCKARAAIAQERASLIRARCEALLSKPELVTALIANLPSEVNPALQGMTQRVGMLEEFEDEELAEALKQVVSDIDTGEIAEYLNTWIRLINRVHDVCPDLPRSFADGLVHSLDHEDARKALGWIFRELLEPLAAPLSPPLLHLLCDILEEAGGHENREYHEAFDRLARLMAERGMPHD